MFRQYVGPILKYLSFDNESDNFKFDCEVAK